MLTYTDGMIVDTLQTYTSTNDLYVHMTVCMYVCVYCMYVYVLYAVVTTSIPTYTKCSVYVNCIISTIYIIVFTCTPRPDEVYIAGKFGEGYNLAI